MLQIIKNILYFIVFIGLIFIIFIINIINFLVIRVLLSSLVLNLLYHLLKLNPLFLRTLLLVLKGSIVVDNPLIYIDIY